MPLILIGLFILIIGFIIVPSVVLLFTNPLIFGVGLIAIGLSWVIFSKLFYGLIFTFIKTNQKWNEVILPQLEKKSWWKKLLTLAKAVFRVIDSELFKRSLAYGLIVVGIILVVYFQKNPLIAE